MHFIPILEEFVSEIGGKDAVKLLNLLKDKENISEFDLAEELKLSINQVRSLLYRLNLHNLVYSNRKKDKEKGWYIYYWTFNFRHARDLLINKKQEELRYLKEELEKERQHRYFICMNDGIRMDLNEALEHNYKCPECDRILKQEDSIKKISEIESRMHKLNQDLEELNKPLIIIQKPALEEKAKRQRRIKVAKKVKKIKVKHKIKKHKIKKLKKHRR